MSLVVSCNNRPVNSTFSVGVEGNIKQIVIPDTADEVIQFAAQELHDYLKKITDADLRIISEKEKDADEPAISLLLNTDTAIKWDGYTISKLDNGIQLSGRAPRALLYAVYSLLEEVGCAFVYPGKREEIIPSTKKLDLTLKFHSYNPLLEHRGLAPYGLDSNGLEAGRDFIDWMAKNRMNYILVSEDRPSDSDGSAHGSVWKDVDQELLPELKRRGFTIDMSEHCTPVFFPRTLFKSHPEWFALNNGKRQIGQPPYSGQICYSNKEAIAYYTNALADYASKHPEFHFIGTWPLDGGSYCECDSCKDPQTVFRAVMTVARKIKEVRPDMVVEHLAYKVETWQPPAVEKIPDNISVLWCRDAGHLEDLAKDWVKKASPNAGVYQFEYFLGDNYRSRSNVWLRPYYAAGIIKHARDVGFRGVISLMLPIQCWWRSSFNNWFFANSCWEPNPDVNAMIKKYCQAYYGAKAKEAEEIFHLVFSTLHKEPYSNTQEAFAARLPETKKVAQQIMPLLDKVISEAQDSIVKERFRRLKTHIEFSVLHCEAFASKKKEDMQRLMEYSRQHQEHSMVLMYPGYNKWVAD